MSKDVQQQKRREENNNLQCLKHTFWAVKPDYETHIKELYLQNHSNPRQTEDWLYLERVRGLNRNATLGALDTKLEKRKKRALQDQQAYEARKLKASTYAKVHAEVQIETEEDFENDSPTYSPVISVPICKIKKKESLPKSAYLIADKAGMSDRSLTQFAAAVIQANGEDITNYNLSVKNTARRRKCIITATAQEILKKQLEDSSSKHYALHWDGKIIKSLTHIGKDVEHVAVILTGTDGQEVLLSIIGIEGPSTADNEAQKIVQVLNESNFNKENIGALVFDTTSLNTGHKNGIVVQLEKYLGRNLLQLECRHHVLELVVGASCSLVYGPTSGPKEDFFKSLIDQWSLLDLKDYMVVEVARNQRELSRQIKEII